MSRVGVQQFVIMRLLSADRGALADDAQMGSSVLGDGVSCLLPPSPSSKTSKQTSPPTAAAATQAQATTARRMDVQNANMSCHFFSNTIPTMGCPSLLSRARRDLSNLRFSRVHSAETTPWLP